MILSGTGMLSVIIIYLCASDACVSWLVDIVLPFCLQHYLGIMYVCLVDMTNIQMFLFQPS